MLACFSQRTLDTLDVSKSDDDPYAPKKDTESDRVTRPCLIKLQWHSNILLYGMIRTRFRLLQKFAENMARTLKIQYCLDTRPFSQVWGFAGNSLPVLWLRRFPSLYPVISGLPWGKLFFLHRVLWRNYRLKARFSERIILKIFNAPHISIFLYDETN